MSASQVCELLAISHDVLTKTSKKLFGSTPEKFLDTHINELRSAVTTKESSTVKVIKTDSPSFWGGFGGWDFFAWLWFSKTAEQEDKGSSKSDEDNDDESSVVINASDIINITTIAHQQKEPQEAKEITRRNATVISKSDLTNFAQAKWIQTPKKNNENTTSWYRSGYQSRSWYQSKSQSPQYSGNKQFKVFDTLPIKKEKKQPQILWDKKPKEHKVSDALIKKSLITIGDSITVKEFSEKMGIPLPEVVKKMLINKIICWVTTSIDFDTASLIASEFNIEVIKQTQSMTLETLLAWNLQSILESDKDCVDPQVRPPIVTVMWHVDHGKTSLLDYLRKTSIVSWEAWGITQSIGASTITHSNKKITFIDTPWHQLFTALRARGAKLTNIAIIVIAADDWIKQQTVEAINHAKEWGVPIIVVATKIDKADADIERIKSQLTEHDLTPEERGWTTPLLWISSKTGQWIDELLDLILLQAEIMDLKYNPHRTAVWVVLDAQKDPRQWVKTSMIVMTWHLKVGHIISVHTMYGKIKKIYDRTGKEVKEATGWDPVVVLWLSEVPEPWRIIEVVQSEKSAITKINLIKEQETLNEKKIWLEWLLHRLAQGERTELKLILKADGPSSLEALKYAIDSLPLPENIFIKKVHCDVGNFTDSDLSLAKAADALLIGFNITMNVMFKKKADMIKVTAKAFDIIYELTDYIEAILKWMIKVELKEVVIGSLNVLWVFYKKEKMQIIGGKITEWKAANGAFFRVIRWDEILTNGKITSLQKEQQSVQEIAQGHECGMKVTVSKKILEWDQLELFVME